MTSNIFSVLLGHLEETSTLIHHPESISFWPPGRLVRTRFHPGKRPCNVIF